MENLEGKKKKEDVHKKEKKIIIKKIREKNVKNKKERWVQKNLVRSVYPTPSNWTIVRGPKLKQIHLRPDYGFALN